MNFALPSLQVNAANHDQADFIRSGCLFVEDLRRLTENKEPHLSGAAATVRPTKFVIWTNMQGQGD
ncbi:MAG: hypothetical protein V4661_13455 [Pseudomonadota bacterium]|jgi:hypothetical protein